MARIDFIALQQRLAQQQPKPATTMPGAAPVVEHAANASVGLAHHAGAESTPSHHFGCNANGHAARDDDHARDPAVESNQRA
jgi:hypothetical protein